MWYVFFSLLFIFWFGVLIVWYWEAISTSRCTTLGAFSKLVYTARQTRRWCWEGSLVFTHSPRTAVLPSCCCERKSSKSLAAVFGCAVVLGSANTYLPLPRHQHMRESVRAATRLRNLRSYAVVSAPVPSPTTRVLPLWVYSDKGIPGQCHAV